MEKIWAYHSKGIGQTKVPAEAIFCKLSKNCSFYISKFFLNIINLLQLLFIYTYVRGIAYFIKFICTYVRSIIEKN